MTGAHWLILAATTVAAVLCLWWTRRRPRVWRQEEVDEIRRRARERSEQTRQWVDEPGDQTHEQIDQALDIATEVDRAKADHLNAAMRSLEHSIPWPHTTTEDAADCTRCSPSSLPRRTEGGDERG